MKSISSNLVIIVHLTMYHISDEKSMAPRYLQLGNQTVDLNMLFKVPQGPREEEGVNVRREHHRISLAAMSDVHVTPHKHAPWLRKHDHDRRHGPHFDDVDALDNSSVTVRAGDTALLDCKVSYLRDKTVSWLHRRVGEPPRLLTVGLTTYTGDGRYTIQFKYPGNWKLQLANANKSDEGLYECQLSTHPPSVIRVYLNVHDPSVAIVDEGGHALREQYYEAESTLSLRCVSAGANVGSTKLWWLHGQRPLHADTRRGGVSVRTQTVLNDHGRPALESVLRLNRLSPHDAGNYTCALPNATAYTVLVHVLDPEESLAELQQGSSACTPPALPALLAAVLFVCCVSVYICVYSCPDVYATI